MFNVCSGQPHATQHVEKTLAIVYHDRVVRILKPFLQRVAVIIRRPTHVDDRRLFALRDS